MKKLISIFGSTGSIGLTSLKIIDKEKKKLKPSIYYAKKNLKLICHQIKKYKQIYFIIANYEIFLKVKRKFKNSKIKILNNYDLLKLRKKLIYL